MFALFAAAFASSAYAYDATLSRTNMDMAGAAYCAGKLGVGVNEWDCTVCKQYPGVNATEVWDRATDANGFVAADPNNRRIVVSFSGTDPLSMRNWIDDISTLKRDYPYCSGCQVHKGFYETYLAVQPQVLSLVKSYRAQYPDFPIMVTGHSLGGALAVHAALDLKMALGLSTMDVYTFGQPRVGNAEFQKFYVDNTAPNYRVTHYKDPVPHLPFNDWSFVHQPTEVFYGMLNNDYQLCDSSGEDPDCSDQYLLDYRVDDHLDYLDFPVITNYLGCKL